MDNIFESFNIYIMLHIGQRNLHDKFLNNLHMTLYSYHYMFLGNYHCKSLHNFHLCNQ